MKFRIKSLDDKEFSALFKLDDFALEKMGVVRMIVDEYPGFPCRVSLEDAQIGEEVILLPYQHHKTNSPYQASGPDFVLKIAKTPMFELNQIPTMFHHRLLSIRGYDKNGMMKEASVIEGNNLNEEIEKTFKNDEIHYIHIHNARPGCFNCVVERLSA
jgi:hypothetical protein